MNTSLFSEGKEYVLATTAAKNFEYSKEYLLLLIKQEKIDGKKFGNRWYVHIPSAENFFVQLQKSNKEWREKIREERKRELALNTDDVVLKVSDEHRRVAVVETFAILFIGSVIGSIVYFTGQNNNTVVATQRTPIMEHVAITLYEIITDERPNSNLAAVAIPESTILDRAEPINVDGENDSLVVFKEDTEHAQKIESIRQSFSDPLTVTIDATNTDTGVIIPKFRDGDGEAYRFLMVSVVTEGGS